MTKITIIMRIMIPGAPSSRSMIMINMIKITSYRSMILMIRPYDDTNNVYGLCYHRDADDKDDDRLLFLNARRSCVSKC